MTVHFPRRSRFAVAGALTAVLLALVTACASSNTAPDDNGETSGSADSVTSADPEQEFEDWQLKFAECMRGEGVDMPDPSTDGTGQALPLGDEATEAAARTCHDSVGPAPSVDGRSDQEIRDQDLEVAQCLRDAGYDVADPRGEGDAMSIPADLPADVLETCIPSTGE